MKPKSISVPASESLAAHVAQAMAQLANSTTWCQAPCLARCLTPGVSAAPAIVVDSPLAAPAIKLSLAASGWPGRSDGAPLPWCGTLEQAIDERILDGLVRDDVGSAERAKSDPDPMPRSISGRRVELAQQLLDSPALKRSLGGSPKAALSLAGQWVELFEGWEWLQAAGSTDDALSSVSGLANDLTVLRQLHQANQTPNDRVAWLARRADQIVPVCREVWFCLARTPSPRELATAQLLWGVKPDQMSIYTHALADLDEPSPSHPLIAANTLEESAWAAAQAIMQWREQGIDDIGVVAMDRKSVRRLRALLERAGESLSDRSGWALDTTVAASAVVGLNDLLTQQATTQSLLEWIHSPFVIRGLSARFGFDATQRRALDESLRGFGRITPVDVGDLIDQRLLPFSRPAMTAMNSHARFSLSQWIERLFVAFEHCGLEEALAQDLAGQSVMATLQVLQAQCQCEETKISCGLWQAVLAEELSRARLVEPMADACVRVVSLSSLSWQQPKAVLIVGAQAGRLPERAKSQFFEPGRYAEMGLANEPELAEAEAFAQFVSLWRSKIPLVILATSETPDSEVEFSPWVELLTDQKPVSAASFIPSSSLNAQVLLKTADVFDPGSEFFWSGELPSGISVSDAQSLIHCPYQFTLSRLLGLVDVADLQEDAAAPDIGSLLHKVLKRLNGGFDSIQVCKEWLEKEIDLTLSKPFFTDPYANPVKLPMPAAIRARLRAEAIALVPALSQWLFQRSTMMAGEVLTEEPVKRTLRDQAGDPDVTLKGRIDRWEKTNRLLIDFKTGDPGVLKKRIGPQGDDVQLPLYAWLVADHKESFPVDDVRYVCIRRDGVSELSVTKEHGLPIDVIAEKTISEVQSQLQVLQQGGAIAATGVGKDEYVCDYCPVRGVCRRDEYLFDVEQAPQEEAPDES